MTEANSTRFNENIFERQGREIYFALKQIGLEENEAWAEARLILKHATGLKQAEQITSNIKEISPNWSEEITRIINLRRERRPLAYCLGEIEFGGLSFRIIPGVLIPRVDTETLVEAVVEWVQNVEAKSTQGNLRIAEIGVGSGIIAISLLKRLPNCTVWGCDISEAAVALTLGNARKHGVHERLTVVHGDWKKILPKDSDVIVSNPPYIPSKKQLQPEIYFEPKEALFAGDDGLDFYRDFAKILPKHFNGIANIGFFEIGDNQSQAILTIFSNQGWNSLKIVEDIGALPRVLMAQVSRVDITIEKPR